MWRAQIVQKPTRKRGDCGQIARLRVGLRKKGGLSRTVFVDCRPSTLPRLDDAWQNRSPLPPCIVVESIDLPALGSIFDCGIFAGGIN